MKSYTLLEIADKADVSQKFLEREIASGNLQGERVNNKWCVSGVSFRKWRSKRSLSKSKSNQIQQTLWEMAVDDQNNSKKSKKDDVVEWIDISKDWNRKDFKKEYSYLDLFSGAGGISLGFEMAGLKGVAAVEIMESAVDTHKTKSLVNKLKDFELDNVLIVSDQVEQNLYLAARNLHKVDVLDVAGLDPVSLIGFEKVLITVPALKKVEEMLS